jgi:hypothetical protein
VDVGSSLAIENPVSVSATERYAAQDVTAWTVAGPFEATVAYYHQWRVRLVVHGLEVAHPTGLRSVEFGSPAVASPWAEWEGWVDDRGDVTVDAIVEVGDRERFATREETTWSIRSARTLAVGYAHEYRPSVSLVGTDADHTVSLRIQESGRTVVLPRLHGMWTDWVEAGGNLEFSPSTDGTPTLYAMDRTNLDVTGAFDVTIRYAPNLKPLISIVYVAVILGVAGVAAHRRPLDLFLTRSEAGPRGEDRGSSRTPAQGIEDGERKTRNDRAVTFLWLALPLGVVEGLIGLLSLQTGFLRVPENGTWLSAGLFVNTILLGLAIAFDVIVHKRGYRPAPRTAATAAPRTRTGGPAR